MTGSEILAIVAVILSAIAILPGTLGVLLFTGKFASRDAGARFIYGKALWVFIASLILLAAALLQADKLSLLHWGSIAAYAGICLFGFFMHTKFLFKPVRKPKFISIDEAIDKFGPDEEVVGVIDSNGRPYAFVSRLARRPHIVYQPEGDAPFIMSHCILAHSSMSYALDGRFSQPDITITSALANNLVFYDKSNQCSVVQIHDQSRDGKLPLKTLPTVAVSLKTWKELFPDSPVWIREREWRDVFYLKLLSRADVIDPASPVIVYPLQHETDTRLPMKSLVNGVKIGSKTRTYPCSELEKQPLIHDEMEGTPLLVVSAFDNDYNQVFDRRVDGQTLTFKFSDDGKKLIDNETGSTWSVIGDCQEGQYKGKQLTPIPHYNKMFWFVWADFHPGTEIYSTESGQEDLAESAA